MAADESKVASSPNPQQVEAWAYLIEQRRAADAERQRQEAYAQEGYRIGLERLRLWREIVVEPLDTLAPDYRDMFARLADQLRHRDHANAATTLTELARIFGEFGRIRENWTSALKTWFREMAEPWNQKPFNTNKFAHGMIWPDDEPPQLAHDWTAVRMPCYDQAKDLLDRAPVSMIESNLVIRDLDTIIRLLALMIQTGTAPLDHVVEMLESLKNPSLVADLCPMLALLGYPDPTMITEWLQADVPLEARKYGRWLLRLAPDRLCVTLCKWFDDEVNRLNAFAQPPTPSVEPANEVPSVGVEHEMKRPPEDGPPAEPAQFVLAREGEIWFIRAFGNEGRFKDLKGFRVLEKLLSRPNEQINFWDLLVNEDALARKTVGMGQAQNASLSTTLSSRQPVIDQAGLTVIEKEIHRLEQEVKEAENDVEREDSNTKLKQLHDERNKMLGLRGKSRDLNEQADNLRSSISGLLRTIYKHLLSAKPSLEKLAEHFENSISSEEKYYFCYRPPHGIFWHFS